MPRDVLVICLGKSTYARCGIIVNVTPLEPGWEGHVTLEFSNTTPLPAKIYANEGACQFLFLKGNERCETSYADRAGKYMGQRGRDAAEAIAMAQLVEPVSPLADKKRGGPAPGIGLAVSGGGYRAMLFHLGAFLRLYELGLLQRLDRISSVSGGSITAAKLALEWPKLHTRDDFFEHVVEPIRKLAGTTIDIPCILAGIALPGSVADYVAFAYRRFLFGDATLQDLPKSPEFLFNATNLETGTLWRFTRGFMADYQVGEIRNPKLGLAAAVAASSAFPPFLSPYVLRVREADFSRIYCEDRRLLSNISLADGGAYDNLGLETVWKRYENVLVSDAGAALAPIRRRRPTGDGCPSA